MRIFSSWILYDANTSGDWMSCSTGWPAPAQASEISFARAMSPARIASTSAIAGCGPIDAAVAQQAVVVAGDSSAKRYTAFSFGRKWIRPPLASRQASSSRVLGYFADMTVGARLRPRPPPPPPPRHLPPELRRKSEAEGARVSVDHDREVGE